MKKTLIIFDIDGTLLYSNHIDSQCFSDAYEEVYKMPFPSIDWSKYPHVTDDTIFNTVIQEQFDRTPTFEELDGFRNIFVNLIIEKRKTDPQEFKAVPNSKNTIEKLLADENYEVGIATGGWNKPAHVKLNFIGISTEKIMIKCADGCPTREDIINGVLNQAKARNLNLQKIVYVGDAAWDVRTTRNLNMPFIGIRRKGDHDFLYELGAHKVLTDYSNYEEFLQVVEEVQPPKKLM